jgi:hypothetical protein
VCRKNGCRRWRCSPALYMTLVCREGWVQKVALAYWTLHMTLICREGWVQKMALANCTLHMPLVCRRNGCRRWSCRPVFYT